MREMESYNKLWQAVMSQALSDVKLAIQSSSAIEAYKDRLEHQHNAALGWFSNSSKDFHLVCDLAGLEPSRIRRALTELLKQGKRREERIAGVG